MVQGSRQRAQEFASTMSRHFKRREFRIAPCIEIVCTPLVYLTAWLDDRFSVMRSSDDSRNSLLVDRAADKSHNRRMAEIDGSIPTVIGVRE